MIFLCITGPNSLIWGDHKILCSKTKTFLIKANNGRENWPAGTVINVDGDWSKVGLTPALGDTEDWETLGRYTHRYSRW